MRLSAVLLLAAVPACTPDVDDGDDVIDPIDEVEPLPECDDGVRLAGTVSVPDGVDVPADAVLGLLAMPFDEAPALDVAAQVTLVEGLAEGADASWSMCLGTPDEEWYQAVDEGSPMEIAAFVVGVWDDADGDGNPTEGETLVGYDSRLVIHARGEAIGDLTDVGGDLGWNVLVVGDEGIDSAIHIVDAHDEHAVQANLAPYTPGELTGVLVPDFGGEEVSIGLYNMYEMLGADEPAEPVLVSLADIAATGDVAWSVKGLAEPPPADHMSPLNPDFPIADWTLYIAGAWIDHNDDGQIDFEQGEPVVAASIPDLEVESFVLVAYVEPTGFQWAQYSLQFGLRPGWGLYLLNDTDAEGFTLLDWSEGMEMVEFSPN